MSKALEHDSVTITEKYYAKWNKAQQDILDEDLTRAWGLTQSSRRRSLCLTLWRVLVAPFISDVHVFLKHGEAGRKGRAESEEDGGDDALRVLKEEV